ncbi:MAG: hypothetical protein ACXVBH_12185 [Flavisolibacter sp.]
MKYLLVSALAFFSFFSLAARPIPDTIAIRQLLEKESATWRSGDAKAHASCWQIRPYSKILVSTPEGKCYDVPPKTMLGSSEGMGKGGHAESSNYLFSIHGNNAWVSHDEQSFAKDGAITYSHEIRILEKIKGEWKLVAQSIHLYRP